MLKVIVELDGAGFGKAVILSPKMRSWTEKVIEANSKETEFETLTLTVYTPVELKESSIDWLLLLLLSVQTMIIMLLLLYKYHSYVKLFPVFVWAVKVLLSKSSIPVMLLSFRPETGSSTRIFELTFTFTSLLSLTEIV